MGFWADWSIALSEAAVETRWRMLAAVEEAGRVGLWKRVIMSRGLCWCGWLAACWAGYNVNVSFGNGKATYEAKHVGDENMYMAGVSCFGFSG